MPGLLRKVHKKLALNVLIKSGLSLHPCFVYASREGPGEGHSESAHLCLAARRCDINTKFQCHSSYKRL